MDWILALIGGLLIGASVSLFLYSFGRVTGISGIIGSLLMNEKEGRDEKGLFIIGLLLGGVALKLFYPQSFSGHTDLNYAGLVLAGLLVGFGTSLGSGCTSGHGVCGISRLSWRSIIATCTFMASGILFVLIWRQVF